MIQKMETEFLRNIAQRLGRQEPLREPPQRAYVGAEGLVHSILPKSHQEAPDSHQEAGFLAEVFCLSLEDVGGYAKVISKSEISTVLDDIIIQHQIRSVLQWKDSYLEHLGVSHALQHRDLDVYTWGEENILTKGRIEQAQLGITSANYAIAETGSLVVAGDQYHGRSVSLLPSVHVAFVPLTHLHLRAKSVLQELNQHRMPAAVNFITGPSRTSDIEMDSTIGVHGPKHIYVFLTADA
ncbi:MAG: LutC/YkgG family protein [Bacilli bacterium]